MWFRNLGIGASVIIYCIRREGCVIASADNEACVEHTMAWLIGTADGIISGTC
ncbi:MAG: hypothetical protein QF728_05075 [Arenicellales bacterium]|nr:hypothetical protein [Arenicellales bacterium]